MLRADTPSPAPTPTPTAGGGGAAAPGATARAATPVSKSPVKSPVVAPKARLPSAPIALPPSAVTPAAPSKPPPANKLGFAVVANPFASPIVATTVVRKEPSKKLGPAEAPAIPPFSLQAAGPVLTPLVAAPIKVAGADTTTQAK